MQTQDRKYDSCSGCLIRLFWLLLGNLALLIVVGQIFFHAEGRFSLLDIVYWLVVVLILAARFVDVRYFKGATVDGKPSSFEDWRRYVFVFIVAAATVWLAVHYLGSFRHSIQQDKGGELPVSENRLTSDPVS